MVAHHTLNRGRLGLLIVERGGLVVKHQTLNRGRLRLLKL